MIIVEKSLLTRKANEFPFRLRLIAVDIVHLISLLAMVYWADPEHVQSLSDEKIVDVLIQTKKIDDKIDVSCSKKASDIIREAITEINGFGVYKKDLLV